MSEEISLNTSSDAYSANRLCAFVFFFVPFVYLFEKQWEKLAVYFLALANRRDAFERGRIGGGDYAVAKDVENHCAARMLAPVFIRAMDHQRVMKRTLALLQLDRHGFELPALLRRERADDRIHVVRKISARQKVPTVTAGDIMYTPILTRRIV